MNNLTRIIILVALILVSAVCRCQNLVPNPSFEKLSICPQAGDGLYAATPWFLGPSTDLWDVCNGYVPYILEINHDSVYPRHGHGFIGMWTFQDGAENFREYAQVKLIDSLRAGQCYYVEFYSRPDPASPFFVNNIAVNFSQMSYSPVSQLTVIPVPSHIVRHGNPVIADTTEWALINGIFIANGGEQYLALGNFCTDQNTSQYFHSCTSFYNSGFSYYFFDSVSVIKINPNSPLPWSYQDHVIQVGDSVYIGNFLGGSSSVKWYTMSGSLIASGPGTYVKPDSTTNYEVRITLCDSVFSDTVQVVVQELTTAVPRYLDSDLESALSFYPSPAVNSLFLQCATTTNSTCVETLEIISFSGSTLSKRELVWSEGYATINLEAFSPGMYFLKFSAGREGSFYRRLIIQR